MKKEIEKKQKSNIGKKILFAIVLPLIFICMIMIIIFSFLGKNIFEEASNIPIIGSIFASGCLRCYNGRFTKANQSIESCIK